MAKHEKHHSPRRQSKADTARRIWVGLAFVAVFFVALDLRVRQLDHESPWFDEIVTLQNLNAPSLPAFLEAVREGNEPVAPLYLSLEYGWARAFDCSWYGLRVLSVIIGMASLVALFELTTLLFGPVAGLLAALALALNITQVYFSQEIRMYALSGLLSILSMRTFIAFHDKGGKGALAGNTILNLLLVWTHPIALMMPGVEALHALMFRRRPWRDLIPWLVLQVLVGASIIAWAMGRDEERIAAQISWLQAPTFFEKQLGMPSAQSFCTFAIGTYVLKRMKTVAFVLVPAVILAYLLLLSRRKDVSPSRPLRSSRETAALLLAWFLGPAILLFTLSHILRPCYVERYLLFSTFPFFMILGALVTLVKLPIAKAVTAAGVLAVMSLSVFLLSPGPLRHPFSDLAAQIRWHATPNDAILFRSIFMYEIEFKHHLGRDDLKIEVTRSEDKLRRKIREARARHANVWVVGVEDPHLSAIVERFGFRNICLTWRANDKVPLELVYIPDPAQGVAVR